MSRIKHCAFCGEPQKEEPCESCGADEEKIHQEMLDREERARYLAALPSAPQLKGGGRGQVD